MAPTALCYSAVVQLCGLPYLGELRRTFTSGSHLHLRGAAGKVGEVCTEGKKLLLFKKVSCLMYCKFSWWCVVYCQCD